MTVELAADKLRAAFDKSFALAREHEQIATEDLIGIELGDARHALRLAELAGVFTDREVTPLPSTAAELVGMAAFRGVIVPVFDLAALVGYARAPRLRWLALAAGAPVAFAFPGFAGYMRVPRNAITGTGTHPHVHAIAHVASRSWPVVSIRSLVDLLVQRAQES